MSSFCGYTESGFPHLLQKRAVGSFGTAPHEPQLFTLKPAPQAEQKSASATFAAPQLPQRPGKGGMYPPALRAMCASTIFQASSVSLYCQYAPSAGKRGEQSGRKQNGDGGDRSFVEPLLHANFDARAAGLGRYLDCQRRRQPGKIAQRARLSRLHRRWLTIRA